MTGPTITPMALLAALVHLALLGGLWFLDLWGGFVVAAGALLASGARCGQTIAAMTTLSIVLNGGAALWSWWEHALTWQRAGLLGAHTASVLVLGWLGLWASVRPPAGSSPPYGDRPCTEGPLGTAWLIALVLTTAALDAALLRLLVRH